MARPTKLTPEVCHAVCRAIRAGNYAEPAARSAAISPATHYRWMERGKAAKSGQHRDYYEAVKQAEADSEIEAVALIRKQMPGDARTCIAFLERRFPSRWRRHSSHELTGQDGGPVAIADLMLTDPETRKALRDVLRRAGSARADQSGGTGAGD